VRNLNFTGIRVQSNGIGIGDACILTGGQIEPAIGDRSSFIEGRNEIEIFLNERDNTVIRASSSLGKSAESTWLALADWTISDMAGNLVEAVSSANGLQANSLLNLAVYTSVVSIELDLEQARLSFRFSNVISPMTFKPRGIVVQSSDTGALGSMFALSTSICSSAVGFVAVVDLSESDMLGLSKQMPAGRSLNTTFISVAANAFTDILGNDIIAISDGRAVRVTGWVGRSRAPQLQEFMVNMSSGIISLSFSEALDPLTIDPRSISLGSGVGGNVGLSLRGGAVRLNPSQKIVEVLLTIDDLNAVKQTDAICVDRGACFLSLLPSFGSSVFGVSCNYSSALTNVFISDFVAPTPLSFAVDLANHSLSLVFDEIVRCQSFRVGYIVVQFLHVSLNLSHSSAQCESNSVSLSIQLSPIDFLAVSLLPPLLTSSYSTLSLFPSGVADMSGNVNTFATVLMSHFIPDLAKPNLLSWDLNLTNGSITFVFDKVMNTTSLNPSMFRFQSSFVSGIAQVTLADLSPVIGNQFSTILTLQLGNTSVAKLQRLLITENVSYVCTDLEAIQDTHRNLLNQIPCENALRVSSFTPDRVSPRLLSFGVNMSQNSAVIALQFDEPIDSLQSVLVRFSSNANEWNLVSLACPNNAPSFTASCILSVEDTNLLKSFQTCLDPSHCHLNVLGTEVFDVSGNVLRDTSIPTPQLGFVLDSTSPVVEVAELDLEQGVLIVSFSEPIERSSFNVTSVTIQSSP